MMTLEQLCKWLVDQNVSTDVIENFRGTRVCMLATYLILFLHAGTIGVVENEMDNEAVGTLLSGCCTRTGLSKRFNTKTWS